MQAKLTLSIEEELIKSARAYARSQRKSLSQVVAEFFSVLRTPKNSREKVELGPVTSQLLGALKGATVGEDDYKDHLLRKYL